MKETVKNDKMNSFSVALGLFDYINPIFYTVTSMTILKNMKGVMSTPIFIMFLAGAILSLIFGFTIPTVKFIVGLGKMDFKMPVNLVFYVNTGILISGLALFFTVTGISPVVLIVILAAIVAILAAIKLRGGKFNTVAVLAGAAGYLLIYISMILWSLSVGSTVSVVMYGFAICLFVFLVLVGCKADLMNPKVHWVIEITNVVCQITVAIATILAFR